MVPKPRISVTPCALSEHARWRRIVSQMPPIPPRTGKMKRNSRWPKCGELVGRRQLSLGITQTDASVGDDRAAVSRSHSSPCSVKGERVFRAPRSASSAERAAAGVRDGSTGSFRRVVPARRTERRWLEDRIAKFGLGRVPYRQSVRVQSVGLILPRVVREFAAARDQNGCPSSWRVDSRRCCPTEEERDVERFAERAMRGDPAGPT